MIKTALNVKNAADFGVLRLIGHYGKISSRSHLVEPVTRVSERHLQRTLSSDTPHLCIVNMLRLPYEVRQQLVALFWQSTVVLLAMSLFEETNEKTGIAGYGG